LLTETVTWHHAALQHGLTRLTLMWFFPAKLDSFVSVASFALAD